MMKGSAKQVAWAEKIRQSYLDEIASTRKDAEANPANTPEQLEQSRENEKILVRGLMSINDASWFIEHRVPDDAEWYHIYELGTNAEETAEDEAEDEAAEAEAEQVERVDVFVDKNRVFETRNGYGLIVNRDYVQWLRKCDVFELSSKTQVTLWHEDWNPKPSKKAHDDYGTDDSMRKWSTWVALEKAQEEEE